MTAELEKKNARRWCVRSYLYRLLIDIQELLAALLSRIKSNDLDNLEKPSCSALSLLLYTT